MVRWAGALKIALSIPLPMSRRLGCVSSWSPFSISARWLVPSDAKALEGALQSMASRLPAVGGPPVCCACAEDPLQGSNGAATSAATLIAAIRHGDCCCYCCCCCARVRVATVLSVCRGQESASRHTYSMAGYYKSSRRAISLTLAETVMPLLFNSLSSCGVMHVTVLRLVPFASILLLVGLSIVATGRLPFQV
jgi:hypothetical protein